MGDDRQVSTKLLGSRCLQCHTLRAEMRVLARECLHGADVLGVDEQDIRLQKYSPNVQTLVSRGSNCSS
jgi:hypothetical protein